MLGGCWEGVGRVLGGCREGVGRVLGGCWEGVGRVLGGRSHILDSCNDKRGSVCHV